MRISVPTNFTKIRRMPENWQKPSCIPYPNVWHKFSKIDKTGQSKEFQIEDAKEELFSECVNFMMKYFIRDETLYTLIGFGMDPQSIVDQAASWEKVLKHKLSLICTSKNLETNETEIVGVYILYYHHKSDDVDDTQDKGEKYKLMSDIVGYLENHLNRYEFLHIDEYLDEFGLCVHPDYRGIGIASELIKTRIHIGSLTGLRVSITVCTSIASRKAAEKVGFKDLVKVKYSELARIFPFFTAKPNDTDSIHYMYAVHNN